MANLDHTGDFKLDRNFDQLQRNITNLNIAGGAGIEHTKLFTAVLADKTVGTTEVTIAHGMAATPQYITITMKTAGNIRLSSAATRPTTALWYDTVNVYVIADAAARVADIIVHA
jgi:hypothetical protein